MSRTLHLDHEIEQRLHQEAQASGESFDAMVNRLLSFALAPPKSTSQPNASKPFSKKAPEESKVLTPEYREMIAEYEQKLLANAAETAAAIAAAANQPPRPRFVVKPFDLGELHERWKGLNPSQIDYELEMEAYEEKSERARHESAGVRV